MIEPARTGFSGSDQPSASVYNTCIRCGLCLSSCPTYLETMTETSGPRGRISLIKAVGEGRLDLLSPGFVAQMSECLDCRACEDVCPSGVRYGELVENARVQIRRARAPEDSPVTRIARRLLLRTLFAKPALMRAAAIALRIAQQSQLLALGSAFGLRRLTRLAPAIPAAFFAVDDRRVEAPDAQGTALLHAGCIMPLLFPAVEESTIRMLVRARLSVTVPRNQGCCGAIAVHAGDVEFARELAKRNIAAFEESRADVYVVNAAGCGSILKEYGRLFADDAQWKARAQAFSSRVRDVTEVLDAVDLPAATHCVDAVATYQEPCHLLHAQRVTSAPRRLLAKIPRLRLVEMDESGVCCGSAGIYNLTEPEMAARLQRRKVAAIVATTATLVITANPGCAIQVESGLREVGYTAEVRHVVEVLDRAYGGAVVGKL